MASVLGLAAFSLATALLALGSGLPLVAKPVAAQTESSEDEVLAELQRAYDMLSRAVRFEAEGQLEAGFDTARDAARLIEGIEGQAYLPLRQYLLGAASTVLGKILARSGQLEDAVSMWTEALRLYQPLLEKDAPRDLFLRSADFLLAAEAAGNIATTFEYLAQLKEKLNKPEEALQHLRAEVEFVEKLGRNDKGAEVLQRMLAIMEANPELPNASRRRAQLLSNIAVAIANDGRADEALPLLDKADKILSAIADEDSELRVVRAEVALRTGYVLQGLGRHVEAIPVLSRAASAFEAIDGQSENRIRALERLFVSFFMLDRLPQAADTLHAQIAAAQGAGLATLEYQARSQLLVTYDKLGRYDLAGTEFAVLREIAARTEIPLGSQARDYANVSLVQEHDGEHQKAVDSLIAAIRLLENESESERERANYHIDLARVLEQLDRPEEARKALENGLKLVDQVDGAVVVASRLRHELAEDDEKRLGRTGALTRQCGQIVEMLADTAEASDVVVSCLVDIGRSEQAAGRHGSALAAFRKAMEHLGPEEPIAFTGGVLSEDVARGRERFAVLTGLGLASIAGGKDGEATFYLAAASRVGRERLLSLPTMVMLESYWHIESLRSRRQAAEVAVSHAFRSVDADVALAHEAAIAWRGVFSDVSRQQRGTLNRLGRGSGQSLSKHYLELRQRVASHVIDWQRPSATSRMMSAQSSKAEVAPEPVAVAGLFGEIREVESTLLASTRETGEVGRVDASTDTRVLDALGSDEILLEYVRFRPLDMNAVRAMDLRALQRGDDEGQHYGVFVVCGATRKVIAMDLGPARTIDDAVAAYRGVQQHQAAPASFGLDEGELATAATPLRELLLEPLAADLRKAGRVYIAVEGQLTLIPFEAIPIAVTDEGPRYLLEDHQVVYLTTGRELLRHNEGPRSTASREAWLFADPDFDATQEAISAAVGSTPRAARRRGDRATAAPSALLAEAKLMGTANTDVLSGWSRLGRTADLIDRIAAVARASDISPVVLTRAAASEPNAMRMHAPRFVVFATHGKFLDVAPNVQFFIESLRIGPEGSRIEGLSEEAVFAADPLFLSMLALAGANRSAHSPSSQVGDGLLTAYESWGLDLEGTELVALAACETGLGALQGNTGLRQPSGEIVAGLRQAILVAGAQSMVMSMWPVPLAETVRSLEQFFRGWLGDKQARYAAFHRSQLAALEYARKQRGSGHPFWWAGFVYVGDPDDRDR